MLYRLKMKKLVSFKNDKVELYYYKYDTIQPNPIIELYRCKLFLQIQNIFVNKMVYKLGKDIFSLKKNYVRTLVNLFSSWIFVQYSRTNKIDIELFPTENLSCENIETTLNDFLKINKKLSSTERTNKIKETLDYLNLNTLMKDKKACFLNYCNSVYFNDIKDKYKLSKEIIELERNKETIKYVKYKIELPFTIKEYKLSKILDDIIIPLSRWKKLKFMFDSDTINFDKVIWCLILRYKCLSSHNHQLAVSPVIMDKMNGDMNLSFECFASSLNSHFRNYCSVFYDLEKYFGSFGSFFKMLPISGTFGFNPPYEKIIIEKGVNNILKLLNIANRNKKDLSFVLTLPIWDKEGKEYMNNYNVNETIIDYGEFYIMEKIKTSKYFVGLRMITKDKFSYLDYNNQCYKDKTIQNTYIILLSSQPKEKTMKYLNQYNYYFPSKKKKKIECNSVSKNLFI